MTDRVEGMSQELSRCVEGPDPEEESWRSTKLPRSAQPRLRWIGSAGAQPAPASGPGSRQPGYVTACSAVSADGPKEVVSDG